MSGRTSLRWGRTLAIATMAVGTLALGACGSGTDGASASATPSTFTVWWFDDADSSMSKAYDVALDQFKDEHPDVKVSFERKSFDQMTQSGQMILNSDKAPDVLEYPKGNATAGTAVKNGLLTDLSSVAKKRGWDKTLPDSLQDVGHYTDKGEMGSGDLYGVPAYGEYVAWHYNIDALKKMGFSAPTDMASFEKQLDAFVKAGTTPIDVGAADYPLPQLIYELALSKADQQWVRNFQFFENPVDFHDKAWTFGAETVVDWVKKGYIGSESTGMDATAANNAFEKGQYPYYLTGTWNDGDFQSNITSFKWGTFPMPGSGLTQGSGGHIFVVPTKSHAKDLAYDFIDKLLDEKTQNAMGNAGGIPVAAKASAITNPVGKRATEDFSKILADNAIAFYPDWPVPGYLDVLNRESQKLVTGSSTPDQFLDAIGTAYKKGKEQAGF